jgi:hypothetical protein
MSRNETQRILADLDASKAGDQRVSKAFLRSFRNWLSDRLQHQGVSPKTLAARLGCSEANIYRMLRANNTTLKSIAGVAHALGCTATLTFVPEATCQS